MIHNRKVASYCANLATSKKSKQKHCTKNNFKFKVNFDKNLLPAPFEYYSRHFKNLPKKSGWVLVLCPFHTDSNPSLGINLDFGGFNGLVLKILCPRYVVQLKATVKFYSKIILSLIFTFHVFFHSVQYYQ